MILVADNVNALNPVVRDAMESSDGDAIARLVKQCEDAGAQVIDINFGYLSRCRLDRAEFLVNAVQDASRLQLILDSPNPEILARGLAVCRNTPILNALSLEPAKVERIIPLAAEHQARLVILLMDERSFSPPTAEEKISLALTLADYAQNGGVPLENLIFDPVLPNMSWADARVRTAENLKTVRLMSNGAVFQDPVRTMIGLSNLRSGMRRTVPPETEDTCLALFAGSGLDYLLADVLRTGFRSTYNSVSSFIGMGLNNDQT